MGLGGLLKRRLKGVQGFRRAPNGVLGFMALLGFLFITEPYTKGTPKNDQKEPSDRELPKSSALRAHGTQSFKTLHRTPKPQTLHLKP